MDDFLKFFTNYRNNIGDDKVRDNKKKKKEKKPNAKDLNPETIDRGPNEMPYDKFIRNARTAHNSSKFVQNGDVVPKGLEVPKVTIAPTDFESVASVRDDFANAMKAYSAEPNKEARYRMIGDYQKKFRKVPYVASYVLGRLIDTENVGGDPKYAADTALGVVDAELARYFRKA